MFISSQQTVMRLKHKWCQLFSLGKVQWFLISFYRYDLSPVTVKFT